MDEITRVVGEALQATEAARGLDSDDFVDNAATILHRSRSIFRRRRRRNRALPSLPGNLPTDSVTALEKKLYKTLGAMIGVSLCHGGPPPNFFAEEFYHLLVGIEVKPQCHLIYNQEIKDQIGKIKQAPTLEAAREAAADAETLLAVAGSFRYITSDEQRDKLVDETLQFFLIDRLRAPIDQFRSGLAESGVLRMMENYPDLMKTLFLQSESVLNTSDLINLFNPQYSPRGHIKFNRETAVCGYWRDWLLDVEDANSSVTLEEILIFATGASTIPPLGFPMKASLNFLHAEDFPFGVKYPLANTCTLTLSLPVQLKYEDFCTDMEDGIGQCTQFGFA